MKDIVVDLDPDIRERITEDTTPTDASYLMLVQLTRDVAAIQKKILESEQARLQSVKFVSRGGGS